MIHRDLYTFLVANVASAGSSVYPQMLPQSVTLPALTYTAISGAREYAHNGDQALSHPTYQVSCWAATYDGAHTLARQVIAAMDSWPGYAGCSEPHDIAMPDVPVYQVAVDIDFVYEEA